jgi:hypothetical protein
VSEEEEDADLDWDRERITNPSPPAEMEWDEPPPPPSANLDYDRPPAGLVALSYDRLPTTLPAPPDDQAAGSASLDYSAGRGSGATTARLVIALEYAYGAMGLLLGLSCIVGGCVLGLNGVAGSTSWTASFLGADSTINDAAPGVVLFVVGLFLVWITKPKVKARNLP